MSVCSLYHEDPQRGIPSAGNAGPYKPPHNPSLRIKVSGFGHVSTDLRPWSTRTNRHHHLLTISLRGLMGFLVPYAALSFGRDCSWIVVAPGVIASSGQVLSLILRHSSFKIFFVCMFWWACVQQQRTTGVLALRHSKATRWSTHGSIFVSPIRGTTT